jgi:WD40 repeat protein
MNAAGRRLALVIASSQFNDPTYKPLGAPVEDVRELARVLQDPAVGGFQVQTLIDRPSHEVAPAVEAFLAETVRDDLVLLYFSGHGVRDQQDALRPLYLVTPNTSPRRLRTSSLPAALVNDCMANSRALRQVLVLDCCFSGAFAQGAVAKGDDDVRPQFEGRGRVVLTASSKVQQAFEGEPGRPSLFTRHLVHGLDTGEADLDGDGHIAVEELYRYAHTQVSQERPGQTPQLWAYAVEGHVLLARSRRGPRTYSPPDVAPAGSQHGVPPPKGPGRLWNVPELPPHFLPRPEQLQAVKDAVLAELPTKVAITGAGWVGLQGMGGIGKSVLAAALVRDEQVRQAFPDGVFWLTIGQTPALVALQNQLAHELGDPGMVFDNPQDGKACLRGLLAGRACLLVLDDVWQPEHVEPFAAPGARGRLLVTTRDHGLVTALGAVACRLDVLDDHQALRLLAEWSGQSVDLLPAARGVATECGRLPLALAVCGAMARDGIPWQDLHEALHEADLTFLNRPVVDYPYQDVLRSLKVSVDVLGQRNPEAARCYLQLAVYRAGEAVPEAAVLTLWRHGTHLKERAARQVLSTLHGTALLRLEGEAPHRRVSLHDLQHDYLRAASANREALHGRLLDAYWQQCSRGWPSGPDDGYFFGHLAYHMAQAGRPQDLRALLLNWDWMRRRLAVTDVSSLVADYDLLGDDAEVRSVQGALRLSGHVLAQDLGQLTTQLLGRLLNHPSPALRVLLDQAGRRMSAPWLRPLLPCLTPPGGRLVRTLSGHGGVYALAVTADRRLALSGSLNGSVTVWDLATGADCLTLRGHGDWVCALAVTPDGRLAVSGSLDGTVKVWDLASGAARFTLLGHGREVYALATAPDGRLALSGSDDGTVTVWDLATGTERLALRGHARAVCALAVTPDGRMALSGSGDGTVRVWDLATGTERLPLHAHGAWVYAVAVTPDGRRVLSASEDGTVAVWDLATRAQCLTLRGHGRAVYALAVTPDGRQVLTGSGDTTVKTWDLATGVDRLTLRGHDDSVRALAVTADGRLALSGSGDGTVKIWDLATLLEGSPLPGHDTSVHALAVTPDGRVALSGSLDGTVKFWDLATGAERLTLSGQGKSVGALALTPDGRVALSGSLDGTVTVWDTVSGAKGFTFQGHGRAVCALAVTPDGRHALTGYGDGAVQAWDLATPAGGLALQGHEDAVYALAVTADGRLALSGSLDGSVRGWDLATGLERFALRGQRRRVCALAVTPDAQWALSGCDDGTVSVCNLTTGAERFTLRRHDSVVCGVAVTADGRRALSGSDDGTVKVWDLASGEVIASFHGESGFMTCTYASLGKVVVAGDSMGRVYFLRLEEGAVSAADPSRG